MKTPSQQVDDYRGSYSKGLEPTTGKEIGTRSARMDEMCDGRAQQFETGATIRKTMTIKNVKVYAGY